MVASTDKKNRQGHKNKLKIFVRSLYLIGSIFFQSLLVSVGHGKHTENHSRSSLFSFLLTQTYKQRQEIVILFVTFVVCGSRKTHRTPL